MDSFKKQKHDKQQLEETGIAGKTGWKTDAGKQKEAIKKT